MRLVRHGDCRGIDYYREGWTVKKVTWERETGLGWTNFRSNRGGVNVYWEDPASGGDFTDNWYVITEDRKIKVPCGTLEKAIMLGEYVARGDQWWLDHFREKTRS
jgi:hypothetical protein